MIEPDDDLAKYYAQRYRLFSRFDAGIQLDRVGWFSATPERIAAHQADRIWASVLAARSDSASGSTLVLVDAFAGVGGNAIQFALRGAALPCAVRVVAVECDAARLRLAQLNAAVYGVAHLIDFVCADAALLLRDDARLRALLRPDGVLAALFLSPPWGGPQYLDASDRFSLLSLSLDGGHGLVDLVAYARRCLTRNVALFLPRTTPTAELQSLAGTGNVIEVEQHRLSGKLKAITVYMGALVDRTAVFDDLHR
jgi:trimethylguanosine synthase